MNQPMRNQSASIPPEGQPGSVNVRQILRVTELLLGPSVSDATLVRALKITGKAFGAQAAQLVRTQGGDDSTDASAVYQWKASTPDDHPSASLLSSSRSAPVYVNGALWGALQLDGLLSEGKDSSEDGSFLSTVARHIGAALERRDAPDAASERETETETQDVSLLIAGIRAMNEQGRLYGPVALLSDTGNILYQNALFSSWSRSMNGDTPRPHIHACLSRHTDRIALQDALQSTEPQTLRVALQGGDQAVYLHMNPLQNVHNVRLCWLSTEETQNDKAESYAEALQQRIRSDETLLQASRLLVGSLTPPFEQLVRLIGETTGAASVQLAVVNPHHLMRQPTFYAETIEADTRSIQTDAFSNYTWEQNGDPPAADEAVCTTAPILSPDGAFYGYIRLEYPPDEAATRSRARHLLSVVSEMLCATLERYISREAFRKEQEHYTHFVSTISEAICRVDFTPPIDRQMPTGQQKERVERSGIIAECNTSMAELFDVDHARVLIGRAIRSLTAHLDPSVLNDVIDAGYRLRNYQLHVPTESSSRYFVLNTTAKETDGSIESLWISSTEVTDQVMLERRMVKILEKRQQQLGKDLHDRIGQQLAGTRMLMQNLSERYFSDAEEEGRQTIERIVEGVKQATEDVSDLQRSVMPIQMGRESLAHALRELVSHIDGHPDVAGIFIHDGTDVHKKHTKRQLYRIAQEAVRNALKHANATRIEVALVTTDRNVCLRVTDNGTGFDPPLVEESGAIGLYSMRYRAELIGGRMDLETDAKQGTSITCRLPLSSDASSLEDPPSN